jgi:hypothetical protein
MAPRVVHGSEKLRGSEQPDFSFTGVLLGLGRVLVVVHGAHNASGLRGGIKDLHHVSNAEGVLVREINIDIRLLVSLDNETKIIDRRDL